MDKSEIEVEKRVRMKRMPVLPTDREKHDNESVHVANRSQCKTEDSRKHLEIESSLPRVAMDRGFLACGTDADLVTNTMLIQKLHSVAEARQVSYEAPEPHAVHCVLENLDANGLGRVLLKGDVGSAAETFVDPVWVGRGERMMAEKSSKHLHQSSGAGENDVRKIESSAKTNDSVLPEEFGCRANSKGILAPWVAGCVACVLHRSEKHHKVRVRSKIRNCGDALTQDDGAVDPGNERRESGTLDPGRATGTSLNHTDANDECPSQRCTASEQWHPGVFTSPTSVPRNGGTLELMPMMGHRKQYVSKSFIRKKSETFGCSERKGVLLRRVSERRKQLCRVVQPETVQRVDQTAGTRSADYLRFLAEAEMKAVDSDQRLDMDDSDDDDFEVIPDRDAAVLNGPRVYLEDNPVSSSAKRACGDSAVAGA